MSQSCLFLDSLLLLGKIGAQETWELMRHSLRTFIEMIFFFFRLSRSLSWWRKKHDICANAPGNSAGLLALLRRNFWSQVCSVCGMPVCWHLWEGGCPQREVIRQTVYCHLGSTCWLFGSGLLFKNFFSEDPTLFDFPQRWVFPMYINFCLRFSHSPFSFPCKHSSFYSS